MIGKLVIVLLGLITLSTSLPSQFWRSVDIEPKIVNGTDALIDEFPFIVSIQFIADENSSYHSCGGSILNEYWILTAAHCIYEGEPEDYLIEYITTEIANGLNGERIAHVEKLIWHEKYDEDELNDDIGLVKVKLPLQIESFDFKVRLPLKGDYFSTGTPAVLAGWGRLGTGMVISTTLQKVDLQIYSRFDCAQIHNPDWLTFNNICAGLPEGGKGQCSGDSGGPLLVSGIQVGIVSWSIKPCAVAPYPGVFTAVSSYIGWIETNTDIKFKLNKFLQSRS